MFPVFSLVLDEDVPADIALIYPELYKDLAKVCTYSTTPVICVLLFLMLYKLSKIFKQASVKFLLLSTGKVTLVQDFLRMGSDQYISR